MNRKVVSRTSLEEPVIHLFSFDSCKRANEEDEFDN